eukprot:239865_1
MLSIILLFCAIIPYAISVQLNISSNTIVSINNYNKSSSYLLGLSAYAGIGPLTNNSLLSQLNKQLGVNVIGYGEQLDGILPTNKQQAVECCNTTNGLKKYIVDGSACAAFKKTYDPSIWNSNYYKQETSITTFIYLKDSCQSGYYPEDYHCFGPDTGGGTPNNADGWWTELMVGFVNCSLQLNPKLQYFHIWNEPNAHFWKYKKNGTYYAEFYYNVTKAIKEYYPNTLISGPVTWCPPISGNTWEDYYVSLMQKIVVTEKRKDLLNYIDFHSYDNGNSNLSAWDYVISSINAVSLYYRIITNGENIRSHITEENVKLTDEQNTDNIIHWNFRTIENAKQIMSLSFNTDKFSMRHLFDFGANTFNFYKSIDYYMHDVIKPILNGIMINFKFTEYKDGFPRYDNGNNIMSQIIYDGENKVTALFINYGGINEQVSLVDLDKKITWNKNGRIASINGVNNAFNVNVNGNNEAIVTLDAYSIAAVSGVISSKPSRKIQEIEFISSEAKDIMQVVGNSTKTVDIAVNVLIKNVPFGVSAEYSYLKFGLLGDAMNDYKWNIGVKVNGKSYLDKQNFVTKIQYNEVDINSTDFLAQMKNGNTVVLTFSGQRVFAMNNIQVSATVPGRFVFASLVVKYV